MYGCNYLDSFLDILENLELPRLIWCSFVVIFRQAEDHPCCGVQDTIEAPCSVWQEDLRERRCSSQDKDWQHINCAPEKSPLLLSHNLASEIIANIDIRLGLLIAFGGIGLFPIRDNNFYPVANGRIISETSAICFNVLDQKWNF